MAWTRLPAIAPNHDWPMPPGWLQRAFPRLKYLGGFAGVAVVGALLAGLQPRHVGLHTIAPASGGLEELGLGLGVGIVLYLATELLIPAVTVLGLEYEPGYEQLFTGSPGGWPVFLGIVLPAVSLREELTYRIALIGVAATLFGTSPWLLAGGSTLLFGAIHFTGDGGVVIAGLLGGGLAIAFVLTNSLLLIVVAHTVVNGAEFVVHYGLDLDPGSFITGR